jgi:transcriptional regulator with XRE-family HTH domain
MDITGSQIKAARALLSLTQAKLGELSGVATGRIHAVECGRDHLVSTSNAIRAALAREGAVFPPDGGVHIVTPKEAPSSPAPGTPTPKRYAPRRRFSPLPRPCASPSGGWADGQSSHLPPMR